MDVNFELNPLAPRAKRVANSSRQIILSGHVQGVGFRPFVYRLAKQYQLTGWVQNQLGQVAIEVNGDVETLDRFVEDLTQQAPALSHPQLYSQVEQPCKIYDNFNILESSTSSTPQIFVPPDYFTCDACRRELDDPVNRRYRYPFINCTQCGPRYTLIQTMPYDRVNTTMAKFTLCQACQKEYENPLDRRFHAEPIACPECGPKLTFHRPDQLTINYTAMAITMAVKALQQGEIVAVKGIGGYHLMCDAKNNDAVLRLRARKHRPDKPLAVMFPNKDSDGLQAVSRNVKLTDNMAKLLTSPMRPILLARKKPGYDLAQAIAPDLSEIGIFLPYSPLHHLLLNDFNGALVATSANLSGEPVLTQVEQVETRLQGIADAFVHHNRHIQRPADDPVFRFIDKQPQPIRPGRGCSPLEMILPRDLEKPVLAVGGHLKNTIALAWDNRVVVSPHIGEMNTPRSLDVFEQVIDDLQTLYNIKAETIICDAHPGYYTHRWAHQQKLPIQTVWHHFAHASALMGDHKNQQPTLMFTWDGVGLGVDGTLWGGETLIGIAGDWQRVASMQMFTLPGGDKIGREPWRSAAALCWQTGYLWKRGPELASGQLTGLQGKKVVHQAWKQRLNCTQSSAVGRIFDAAAALVLGIDKTSFEGQGPMQLEAIADGHAEITPMPMKIDKQDILRVDWSPLLPKLSDETVSKNERAAGFHFSMANNILEQAQHFRTKTGVSQIGLCGGVFQNKRLTELAVTMLRENGFDLLLSKQLPINDAGLSFGQIVEYTATQQ